MHYVVDMSQKYVTHQGNEDSCKEYVRNVRDLFNKQGPFVIVKGSKEVKEILKGNKS